MQPFFFLVELERDFLLRLVARVTLVDGSTRFEYTRRNFEKERRNDPLSSTITEEYSMRRVLLNFDRTASIFRFEMKDSICSGSTDNSRCVTFLMGNETIVRERVALKTAGIFHRRGKMAVANSTDLDENALGHDRESILN